MPDTRAAIPTAKPAVIYLLKMFPRFSETFIVNEILALEELGFDVRIYALKKPGDGKFHAELARLKARARYIPEYVLYALPQYAGAAWHVLRRRPYAFAATLLEALAARNVYAFKRWMQALWLARELGEDTRTGIHCHFAMSAPRVAYFLRKLHGNPYTFTAHAKDIYLKSTPSALLRRKIELSQGVVTVCDFNRRYLIERFAGGLEDKITRIYNGIDLDAFTPAPFEERLPHVILSVSRLVEKKGLDDLIEACALLREEGVSFECRIAGEGPMAPLLRRRVAELKLENHVTFPGPITQAQVRGQLASCALLVAPSREAGDGNLDALPTILLEALATATPVISTTVTGIPEIVDSGEQGILVPPGRPRELAAAIAVLLRDPEARRRMGEQGRLRARERFDRRTTAGQLAAFLRQAHGTPEEGPPLRVGYVLTVFPRLSETFIIREIRELERQGAEVTVFSQKRPSDTVVHGEVRSLRARVIYLSPWWKAGPALLLAHLELLVRDRALYLRTLRFATSRGNRPTAKKFWRAARIATTARRERLEYLHSHFLSANTRLTRLAATLAGLPYGITAHAKDIYAAGLSDRKMGRRLSGAAFVATISARNRDYLLERAPGARIKLIPNSVDPDRMPLLSRPVRPDTPLHILAVGRLVEKKGFAVLVESLAQLVGSGIDARLRIVGEGPERERLASLARRRAVEERLCFAGARSQEQLRDDYGWADVLAVPSVPAPDGDVDGVPVVILEAMALGVPVIASRLSGIPEVVQDGENGILVEPGDAPALAAALAQLRPETRSRLAASARLSVERDYDIRKNVRRLHRLMRRAARKESV